MNHIFVVEICNDIRCFPVWARTYGLGTYFMGIAATNEGDYPVARNWSLTSDGVGGKEDKGILAKFGTDGSNGAASAELFGWVSHISFPIRDTRSLPPQRPPSRLVRPPFMQRAADSRAILPLEEGLGHQVDQADLDRAGRLPVLNKSLSNSEKLAMFHTCFM